MTTNLFNHFLNLIGYVWNTLKADSPYLILSILIAACLSVYLNANKAKSLFLRYPRYLIGGSVALGAFTPLCACGTMAVVLSLMTTALPWGPIMAFLVSSPLMSPDTFILFSGILGFKFTVALATVSVILGLGAGWMTIWIERHTGLLEGQLKITRVKSRSTTAIHPPDEPPVRSFSRKLRIGELLSAMYSIGIMKILPLFLLFVVIAYLVKTFIPTSWIIELFSGEKFYSVPLAALIGLPLYVSDATVVPLLQVLRDAGASDGAVMAFMITGPATSVGVVGGLTLILKRNALMLYILIIFAGSLISGILYNLLF